MINLKKILWIIISIIIVILFICIFYKFNKNNEKTYNYTLEKTSSVNQTNTSINIETKKEELLSTFSTKIYSKDPARQNNITITCKTLNNTIIPNGETFSFCDTIGKSTTEKGYQEADIYDKDGNKQKGLGGGNCQVSTTLYNAILKIQNLIVIERHEHSNKVPYIETGKDSAVAYGSYDLKFRNDTGYDIKIKSENSPDLVTINIYKIF